LELAGGILEWAGEGVAWVEVGVKVQGQMWGMSVTSS